MTKCPKCGAAEHRVGVFVCGTQIPPAMSWEGETCRVNQVKNQLATVTAERDSTQSEFDKLLRSMFRVRALAMKRETCDARAIMDEFHRVAGFYDEPNGSITEVPTPTDWEARCLATARENMHLRAALQYVVDNMYGASEIDDYLTKVLHELDNPSEVKT